MDDCFADLKVRKRLSGDNGLSPDEGHSALSEDSSQDNDGFATVLSQRAKRAKKTASSHSSLTVRYSMACECLTVVLVLVAQTNSLSSISRLTLSKLLDSVVSDEIKKSSSELQQEPDCMRIRQVAGVNGNMRHLFTGRRFWWSEHHSGVYIRCEP